MGWSVSVNLDGLNWKCDTLADSATDLTVPLVILGARLKRKALARYKAQAFAPLAASTIEHRAQKGLRTLERKLKGDVRRAFKRARLARGGGGGGLLERMLSTTAVRRAAEDAVSSQSRGAQNRLGVLGEFQRRHKRGLQERAQGRDLTLKQQASLAAREERAVARAVGGAILGGLDKTLVVIVEDGSVTLRSATHQEWSDAHNEGATVGKGAVLPKRETVTLEQDDIDFFIAVLKDHLLLPITAGAQGPGF